MRQTARGSGLEVVDRALDLEGELGNAVAEVGQGQALEHDVGDAAVGGRIAGAFLGLDQAVGKLVGAALVESMGDGGEIELATVGPHAAEARDGTFTEGYGEVGVVAVLDAGGGTAAEAALAGPAAAGFDDLLLEVGRPDDLASKTRAAVEARDRRAFGGGHDAQIGEARALLQGLAGRPEQRLVDERSG